MHLTRTERAKQILSTTNRSITEVAFSVGYNDVRTFERAFKKHNTVMAREYKLRSRPTPPRGDH